MYGSSVCVLIFKKDIYVYPRQGLSMPDTHGVVTQSYTLSVTCISDGHLHNHIVRHRVSLTLNLQEYESAQSVWSPCTLEWLLCGHLTPGLNQLCMNELNESQKKSNLTANCKPSTRPHITNHESKGF